MNEQFIRSVLEDREREISQYVEKRRAVKSIEDFTGSPTELENKEHLTPFVRSLRWLLSIFELFPRAA